MDEVPTPRPGRGEVSIRVHAAGLNPVDLNIAQGRARLLVALELPIVVGSEAAGTVEEIGPDVQRFAPGDRVFVRTAFDKLGAFADVLTTDETLVAAVPDNLPLHEAAVMPTAALTALQALRDSLSLHAGMRILITGGAGGVGTFAIQMAKIMGAHVTTTASPRGKYLVRSLGADEVVDYTTERICDLSADQDVVLDLVGGRTLEEAFRVVKPGGKIASIAGIPDAESARNVGAGLAATTMFRVLNARRHQLARRAGVTYRFVFVRPNGADLAELARYASEDGLRAVLDREYSFDRIDEALSYVKTGRAKGKVAVRMAPDPHNAGLRTY
ncbi:NADP-dependent oxidoreductase [Streptomyces sp. NPDC096354]|uniref:NADP-dependent oxidoreductase n=1 Tax=Streptomyces sp. NPDC096354 TaxID=3366088 RepID=UPI003830CB46